MSYSYDFAIQHALDRGLVSTAAIAAARENVAKAGTAGDNDEAVLRQLITGGDLTWEGLTASLAEEFAMELAHLGNVHPEPDCFEKLDRETATRYGVFPVHIEGRNLIIAISDPLDTQTVDSLSHLLGLGIEPRLASPDEIAEAIKKHYEGAASAAAYGDNFADVLPSAATSGISIGGDQGAGAGNEQEAPIIRYVFMLITEAIKRRASDIHLEPLEKRFRVRYRIDGVLQEMESPPKRLQPAIINRLKIMAKVSIAEKRVPLDGRIQVKYTTRELDLRVSTLPTAFGESIVMRILDKEGLKLGLVQLGFFSDDQVLIDKIIGLPDGIFLVTGPTGSGKSTTLYSCLNKINNPDRKIITVEDPVEYQMAGINQVQVRKEVGMDFASALRAMLRQAPNVIMVGEIRDKETAEIAINASLTGHLVFSTLHTNDAPSAVSRLVDIGVKPFLVSAALRSAMAQRLVRVVCNECKKPYSPDPAELRSIGITEQQAANASFMMGSGCPKCNGRGYRGRNGIFEILMVNDEIRSMIYENSTLVELRRKARELGMRTMREDGVRKVLAGVTTIEEVATATVITLE